MKKLVGERDLEAAGGGVFVVSPEMILTPSARDYASRHNIRLQWPSADAGRGDETAMDRAIRDAVTAELGRADDHVISAVRASLGEATPPGPARLPVMETPASRALRDAVDAKEGRNRAVLSAMGSNRTGILTKLTAIISDIGCDIVDVSQTLVGGYFTMILIVELDNLGAQGVSFGQFRDRLLAVTKELGLEAMIMHEDVLQAMHRV